MTWIEANDENDRYCCGHCFRGERCGRPGREDQIDRTMGQFRCQRRQAIVSTVREQGLDSYVLALGEPVVEQAAAKFGYLRPGLRMGK